MANPLDLVLRLTANTAGFNSPMDAARSAATALAGALAAIGLGLSAKEFIDIADATQQMASRLKNATDSTAEYNEVQARLLNLANSTYRPLAEAQEVYLSTAATMKSLGYSTEQILAVTESLSLSFTHNATRADQAQAAQDALSKAMAKGAVDADAWASIITGADNVVKDLALSTGRTESEVRSLGANGKISINELTNALIQSRDRNQELADAMSTSTADGIQYLKNNVTALIGSLNEQYDITGKLSSVLVTMGDNLDWLSMLFDDAIQAVEAWSASFDGIDSSTIDALKNSLSAAYDLVKDLISTAFELGSTIFEVFTSAFDVIGIMAGGVDDAGNSMNGLTLVINTLNAALGFVSDGVQVIKIGINLLTGVFFEFGASVSRVLATFTFGDVSRDLKAAAEMLSANAKKNFAEADQIAMDFESKGLARIKQAQMSKAEINAQELADAKAKYDAIDKQDDASAQTKTKAAQAWAAAAIKANDGVLSEQLKNDLAAKGFGVTVDDAGNVAVSALKTVEVAAGNTGEALKRNAEEAAKVLKIDLYEAINGISESFNNSSKSLDTFIQGMDQLGITGQRAGEVTYRAWLEWLKTAKSQEEVTVATFKLQEFGEKGQLSTQQVEMGMQAIRQVVQKLPADLDPVEQAFERLGIKTKEQLKLAAQSALADFATIAASGQGTAEDVRKAYERTMQAAIASGDAAVIGQAKAKASAAGLTVAIDETGKVTTKTYAEIVSGSDKTAKSVDRISNSFDRAGQAGVSAARATAAAWDNTVTSLTRAAEKLDAMTKASGGTTGKDFLEGDKDTRFSGNSFNLPAYSQDQIAQKLMSELGYDKQKANLKAKDIFNDQSWSRGGASITNGQLGISSFGEMSNGNYVDMLVNKLAGISSGTTGQPAKTVRYDLNMGNQQATLYGEQGSEAQTDAFLRQLETLKKGM